jgi:hypothetical protein
MLAGWSVLFSIALLLWPCDLMKARSPEIRTVWLLRPLSIESPILHVIAGLLLNARRRHDSMTWRGWMSGKETRIPSSMMRS